MTDTALPRSGMPEALPAVASHPETVQLSKSAKRSRKPHAVLFAVVIAGLAFVLFAQAAAAARTTNYHYSPKSPVTFRAVIFSTRATCGSLRPCRYVWYDDGKDGPRGKQRKIARGKRVRIIFGKAGTRHIRLKVYNRRGWLKAQRVRTIKVRNARKASSGAPANPAPAPAPATPTAFVCTSVLPSAAALQSALAAAPAGAVLCLPDGNWGSLNITGSKAGMVVVAAQHPGAATLSSVTIGGSNVGVANFNITGGGTGVHVNNGAQHILIAHNRIANVGTGIEAASTDPSVGNSPCPSCQGYPPFVDITIDGNVIQNPGTDAIYVGNFNGLTVTNNEITGVEENGDHSDCLQSTFGGKNITFQGNYEHDNLCQGFFLKDGDVTGARFIDNLFIKGQGSGDMTNVTNVTGLVVQHNTIWDGKGFALRHQGNGGPGDAVVDHNVVDNFSELDGGGWSLSEDYDLFGQSSGFTTGPHTTRSSNPPFANPAAGDYRLTDGSGRGVTWAVGQKHFGP
jgi:Right handed beta helix region